PLRWAGRRAVRDASPPAGSCSTSGTGLLVRPVELLRGAAPVAGLFDVRYRFTGTSRRSSRSLAASRGASPAARGVVRRPVPLHWYVPSIKSVTGCFSGRFAGGPWSCSTSGTALLVLPVEQVRRGLRGTEIRCRLGRGRRGLSVG